VYPRHVPLTLKASNLATAVVLAAACTAAAIQGVRATRGLRWPGDPDFARDIASAEAIAAGHPLSDPFYRGEWAWYNPLVPSLVAGVATTAGQPIPLIYARLGAYLNLAAPIAFFALVAAWWGRLVGLAAVLAFLFLIPGRDPGWLAATYSPWLLPMHVAQGFAYLALIAVAVAWREQSVPAFAIAGAAIGLVFLTHTAPALLIGGVMAVEATRRLVVCRDGLGARWPKGVAICLVVALVVSAPFLASIAWHYRLQVRNAAPMAFVAPELALENAWSFVRAALTPSVHGLIAAAGWVWLVRRRRELEARVLLVASITALAFLLYSYFVQTDGARALALSGIVPGHHFVYYLRAFEAVAFGLGLYAIAGWVGHGLSQAFPGGRRVPVDVVMAALVGAVSIAAAWTYPGYGARADFWFERQTAERNFADAGLRGMYEWLRRETSAADVVLAPLNTGQYVVGAAGRKVVAVDKLFSNPYVDWGERARDRDEMDRLFTRGEWTPFLNRAARHRVRYVVRRGELPTGMTPPPFLSVAWKQGEWVVYRVGR